MTPSTHAHFSKTLTTLILLAGLVAACGDGASMPDDMNPDEGGASGTDPGTGGTNLGAGGDPTTGTGSGGTPITTASGGSGGTSVGTGGTNPGSTGGMAATGGSATGGASTGGSATGGTSTGGSPSTGGAGGTVSGEVPKPKAELTKEDAIFRFTYAVAREVTNHSDFPNYKLGKILIVVTPLDGGGYPGCWGSMTLPDLKTPVFAILVRPATREDFASYPTGEFHEELLQEKILEKVDVQKSFDQMWDVASGRTPGACPGFPRN